MLLTTLLSVFTILSAVIAPGINEFDTREKRTAFLQEELAPFTAKADQLNAEIKSISLKVKALSPEKDRRQIVALTEEMTEKMGQLQEMFPTLQLAQHIDDDLQEIARIVHQEDPLSPRQQQVIDRVFSLKRDLKHFR